MWCQIGVIDLLRENFLMSLSVFVVASLIDDFLGFHGFDFTILIGIETVWFRNEQEGFFFCFLYRLPTRSTHEKKILFDIHKKYTKKVIIQIGLKFIKGMGEEVWGSLRKFEQS
jgi:hypothetical protein